MESKADSLESEAMFACWGKLASADESSSYHPLLCHMVDVAMVTREMWHYSLSPSQRGGLSIALGLGHDQDSAGLWCAFLAGLHDLGKASPAFQLQVERVRTKVEQRLRDNGLTVSSLRTSKYTPHGVITAATLPCILTTAFGMGSHIANRIGTVIGGHHGVFPTSSETQGVSSTSIGNQRWDHHRRALVDQLANVLVVPRDQLPDRIDNAAAMTLAGFVSVSDWVGSNTDYFPYAVPTSTEAYACCAEKRARRALDALGFLMRPGPREVRGFAGLFPGISKPNDLQHAIESLAGDVTEPGLVIIEAPMGEGKTEAAIYLADNWAASAGQEGHYFALPTQTTSNQMFGRVRDFLHDRYADSLVQLQLLHGHASLSSEFEALRQNHDRIFAPRYSGVESDSDHMEVVASEWFTYRKRGLLSPFGVGTIDQALLAILQARHMFVRLFGLSHKTVIIDEVHAYDTYMTALLERLLEWLAALGSSVVLLSATLPRSRRDALLNAYLRGLGAQSKEPRSDVAYPRISWVSGNSEPGSRTVSVSPRGTKEARLEWTDGSLPAQDRSPFPLGERLEEALVQGGCAAVICNTVRRAQEVYRALKPYFSGTAEDGEPELDLLHAQYTFQARDEREKRSLVRFGKPGASTSRPHKAVLVATQVIEQSLDLDFDVMVSDLAPADLLLQRVGRLHRHERPRPNALAWPQLLVCKPEMEGDVPRFDPGTTAVYDSHILLRSWLTLGDRTTVRVPVDVESIIADVYDDDRHPHGLSEQLREAWFETQKELQKAKEGDSQEARVRWIKPPSYGGQLWRLTEDPREEDAPDFHQAHRALTRLTPPSVSVILLFGTYESAWLDAAHRASVDIDNVPSIDAMKQLLMRSANISDRRVVFQLLGQLPPKGWQRTALLRNHRSIFLDGDGCSESIDGYSIRLDSETGLTVFGLE